MDFQKFYNDKSNDLSKMYDSTADALERNKQRMWARLVGGDRSKFNQLGSGSGAEQIPSGFQNEYIPPEAGSNAYDSMAKLKMAQSVGDAFQYDTPTPTPNAIEQPSVQQQMLTDRGEGTTISPILGRESLTELERMKMAQALRGY